MGIARSGVVIVVGLIAAAAASIAQERSAPETRTAAVGDGEIEYVVSGPTDGQHVLLIHGPFLGTALALIQTSPALERYRVTRMHRRGYVGSSRLTRPPFQASEAADALGLLDALGVARAHVVTHSSGAVITLEMAKSAPERLETLILLDPAGLGADLGVPNCLAPPPWAFSRADVATIDRPALVLWCEEGLFREEAMALAAALPAGEGRGIAGTDHALITQKPDEVARAIAEFIARQ